MDNISLDDVNYGTTGWNGLVQTNFEKIETWINNKLNHDRILCLDNQVLCLNDNVLSLEGD
ncbi:MAG: hypothetical protein JXB42_01675 [Deltaproteobacteria bacterium]|nr:hypothetical protein [Deltaproteobacteria bacterium]